jgi:hypothetical protein
MRRLCPRPSARVGLHISTRRLYSVDPGPLREIGNRRAGSTEATGTVVLRRRFPPVSGDLRLGGKYQLGGNAGGEILACEPPSPPSPAGRATAATPPPDRPGRSLPGTVGRPARTREEARRCER